MELTKTNGFCEMNEMEMQEVDGGSITLGGAIAIGLFLTGCGIGVGWALCD